jgi:hypothetical protein
MKWPWEKEKVDEPKKPTLEDLAWEVVENRVASGDLELAKWVLQQYGYTRGGR